MQIHRKDKKRLEKSLAVRPISYIMLTSKLGCESRSVSILSIIIGTYAVLKLLPSQF
jgi:hypothetical protein